MRYKLRFKRKIFQLNQTLPFTNSHCSFYKLLNNKVERRIKILIFCVYLQLILFLAFSFLDRGLYTLRIFLPPLPGRRERYNRRLSGSCMRNQIMTLSLPKSPPTPLISSHCRKLSFGLDTFKLYHCVK